MLSSYSGHVVGIKESQKIVSPSFLSPSFQELDHLTEMGCVFHGAEPSSGYSCYGGGDGATEKLWMN